MSEILSFTSEIDDFLSGKPMGFSNSPLPHTVPDATFPVSKTWRSVSERPTLHQLGQSIMQSTCSKLKLTSPEEGIQKFPGLDLEALEDMKRIIKSGLRSFDDQFAAINGRMTRHEDKDVIRPLYALYRRVRMRLGDGNSSSRESSVECSSPTIRFNRPTTPLSTPDRDSLRPTLTRLQTERQSLRNYLEHFQTKFEAKTGRKMRSGDFDPVEKELARYRDLKAKIIDVSKRLGVNPSTI